MSELLYSESDIPYEELERFGLNRQLIGDLPQQTLMALLRGERSPVLPLRIRVGKKQLKAYSRFRLVPREEIKDTSSISPKEDANYNQSQGQKVALLGVLFLPRLIRIQEDLFTQSQIDDIYAGNTVKVTLPHPTDPSNDQPEEYYCQLDPNTRELRSVPAELLEFNLKTLDKKFQLNSVERHALVTGTPITVYAAGQPISFGIDLHDSKGVRLCIGDTQHWRYEFENNIQYKQEPEKEYHFATNGCWIESQDGTFEYVDEDDYDQTILDKLQQQRDQNIRQSAFFRGR